MPKGVERLRRWSGGRKIVWNCIECSRIHQETGPTPRQVRAEVWMSLIHGSQGLIYFVHEWKPRFSERALLKNPEMLAAVTEMNLRIQELAPVLNSPTIADGARVVSSQAAVPICSMVKRYRGATFLFSASMRETPTTGAFTVAELPPAARADVLGEDRRIEVIEGKFEDAFDGYAVHLYRIR